MPAPPIKFYTSYVQVTLPFVVTLLEDVEFLIVAAIEDSVWREPLEPFRGEVSRETGIETFLSQWAVQPFEGRVYEEGP